VRIIAGRFKGRKLKTVKGGHVRSTADRVKETLFNILAVEIEETVVCDLFCGAGTLGLEALSRGARSVVFVDSQRRSIHGTEANIALVGVEEETTVLQADVWAAWRKLGAWGEQFSLIFADPPYNEGWPAKILKTIAATAGRADEGILVIEHHKKDPPGDDPSGFSLLTSRRFGDTVLSIWRWGDPETSEPTEAGHGAEVSDE
jgi:16S rRNA (guanine(966)-N(2))-methyltransferase RsmD